MSRAFFDGRITISIGRGWLLYDTVGRQATRTRTRDWAWVGVARVSEGMRLNMSGILWRARSFPNIQVSKYPSTQVQGSGSQGPLQRYTVQSTIK